MHYYQFNIGDYSSHTSRLSIYEDIAYRRLLDLYYLSERPLNGCSTDVAREIGMSDSLTDVEYVLNKFFIEKNGSWYNKRCDNEIKVYHNKQKSAKKAGVASGIARKKKRTTVERPLNEKRTDVEPNINHKPLTSNDEPITNNQELLTIKQEDQKIISSKLDVESQVLLNYLNDISGKAFKHVDSNLKLIKARLGEGHSEKDIYAVIDRKVAEWENDPKMAKYIRPATLFNAEKFNQYVGELGVETPEDKNKRKIDAWLNEGEVYEH